MSNYGVSFTIDGTSVEHRYALKKLYSKAKVFKKEN